MPPGTVSGELWAESLPAQLGNEKHQQAAVGHSVAARAGCREEVGHGAPQPSLSAVCPLSQPTHGTVRQACRQPPVHPMSYPPAFPVILGGVIPSGQGYRGIHSPGPSCMGSSSRRAGARAALAHDFGGSRERQARLASLEAHWHSVGLLVPGEAGMLMGLISARERQWEGKKASRRESKKSSAITG